MTWEEAKREMMFAKRNVLEGSYIDQAYDKAIEALDLSNSIVRNDMEKAEKYKENIVTHVSENLYLNDTYTKKFECGALR